MHNSLSKAENYLKHYMKFQREDDALVTALYAAATHLWPHFDAFPYLHITANTKRAGKTRLSELLGFLAANAFNVTGATAATIFHTIRDESPTLLMDEIESLSSEAANTMRSVLNAGYRQGQTVPRMGKGGVVEQWPSYCPKVFIGIGDLFDTLRDRTIQIRLVRSDAPTRFVRVIAEPDGQEIRDELHKELTENRNVILDWYQSSGGLSFLTDRDEEIWMPLFAVCNHLAPECVEELKRIAVDMATLKTAVARRHVELVETEEQAMEHEYGVKLLRDLSSLIAKQKKNYMISADLLDALKAIPTAPWRAFRGDGLTVIDMANLLSKFGVNPKQIKVSKGVVRRGYKKEDVEKGLATV